MKIVQVSTYDIQGGAGRAAYRLHLGLRQLGHTCHMLVRYKTSVDNSVMQVKVDNQAETFTENLYLSVVVQNHYLDSHRTDLSNTSFSLPYPGYDLSTLPVVQTADVINLHWIARYLSPITIQKLGALRKPIIWTLHDQWAFSGGCHYSAGCNKYWQDCIACPQLADDPFNLPSTILRDNISLLKGTNLTLVTPSYWLADCVKKSRLFNDQRVEVIPNSLETDIFYPVSKEEAKSKLGLGAETVVLLFGAVDSNEKRKGLSHLLAAVKHCLTEPGFQDLVAEGRVKLVYFGVPSEDSEVKSIPIVPLGLLNNDEEIRLAYSAADLFILPSLEDNLPNTVLEAMSCGTPVLAFNIGGIPDLIKNGLTGYLVPPGNAHQLGEAILSLLSNPAELEKMGQTCRRVIEEGYTLERQAQEYLNLYQELHQASTPATPERVKTIQVEAQSQETSAPSVLLDPTLGPHFQTVYEAVLFKALKEFAPFVQKKWQEAEVDRAARLQVIQDQGRRLGELEAERNNLQYETADLRQHLTNVEADRAARLQVIQEQGRRLGELEAERNNLQYEAADLRQHLTNVEADRATRLEVIQEQGRRLGELEAERNNLQHTLTAQHEEVVTRLSKIESKSKEIYGQLKQTQNQSNQYKIKLEILTQQPIHKLMRRLGKWGWLKPDQTRQPGPVPLVTDSNQEIAVSPEFRAFFDQIREPKKIGPILYGHGTEEQVVQRLNSMGWEVIDYEIDVADYRNYFATAQYTEKYPQYYSFNLPEKSLEHYIAARLLQLNDQDIYIDIASEHSPVPDIYGKLFGVKAYRQDLAYPPGLNGDTIGGDAAHMPVPDGFATKMALHCSLEHFEGNADIGFIHEVARVLKPGGALCSVPLYLFEEYAIQTDVMISVPAGVIFEPDATVYCAENWNNRHGRFYDPEHFVSRIVNNLGGLHLQIYRIVNAREVDKSCYVRFAMLINKPQLF